MIAGLRIDHYEWQGGREAMLRFGPETGPVVVVAPPLFEEANRTRAFLLSILRALAERSIGSVMPDLPGQGDSALPTKDMTWGGLRGAFAALCEGSERPVHSLAIRSGALIDGDARVAGRWWFAPQNDADLSTEWRRLTRAGGMDQPDEIAGNLVSPMFLAELPSPSAMKDAPARVVRLTNDPRPADRTVDGAPLWRRSEPGNDLELVAVLADDIARWIARCEG